MKHWKLEIVFLNLCSGNLSAMLYKHKAIYDKCTIQIHLA